MRALFLLLMFISGVGVSAAFAEETTDEAASSRKFALSADSGAQCFFMCRMYGAGAAFAFHYNETLSFDLRFSQSSSEVEGGPWEIKKNNQQLTARYYISESFYGRSGIYHSYFNSVEREANRTVRHRTSEFGGLAYIGNSWSVWEGLFLGVDWIGYYLRFFPVQLERSVLNENTTTQSSLYEESDNRHSHEAFLRLYAGWSW